MKPRLAPHHVTSRDITRLCTKVEDVSGGVHQRVAQDGVAHDLMQQDVLVQR